MKLTVTQTVKNENYISVLTAYKGVVDIYDVLSDTDIRPLVDWKKFDGPFYSAHFLQKLPDSLRISLASDIGEDIPSDAVIGVESFSWVHEKNEGKKFKIFWFH